MDLYERELDSLIQQALPLPVTAQQKQRAWEQLQLKLVAQSDLAAPCEKVVTADPLLYRVWRGLLQGLRSFALEETRYETARQGRYTFSYYSFSTHPPRFAIDIMCPLRVSAMGQVC